MTAPTPTPPTPPPTRPTKALIGAGLTLVEGFTTGLIDGHLTWLEGCNAVLGTLAVLGAVYGVTNRPRGPQ